VSDYTEDNRRRAEELVSDSNIQLEEPVKIKGIISPGNKLIY